MTIDEIRQTVNQHRFLRGSGFAGPEFYGCCNTGMRPVIKRCPYREIKDPFFMVGPEIAVDQHKRQIALDRIAGKQQFQYGDDPRRTVFVFKTKSNAMTKFLELCQKVLDYNQQEREEIARLQQKAKQGDHQAILSLGLDH